MAEGPGGPASPSPARVLPALRASRTTTIRATGEPENTRPGYQTHHLDFSWFSPSFHQIVADPIITPTRNLTSYKSSPHPPQCLLSLIHQQLRKHIIGTTEFLVPKLCFFVNPTTFSLEHNRDPLNWSGMVPCGPSAPPFTRAFPQSPATSNSGSKKRRGGALDHPPSSGLAFPSQSQALKSLSGFQAGRLLLAPECDALRLAGWWQAENMGGAGGGGEPGRQLRWQPPLASVQDPMKQKEPHRRRRWRPFDRGHPWTCTNPWRTGNPPVRFPTPRKMPVHCLTSPSSFAVSPN